MEEEIKNNWNFLKVSFAKFEKENKNPCHPYLTEEDEEIFQQKMKRSIRKKKLERIFKVN